MFTRKLFSRDCLVGLSRFSDFKSGASLDVLYPTSSLNILRTVQDPTTSRTTFTGYIPIQDLRITYSCASGPGGQNVNKVATKVEVRFNLKSAAWIPDDLKQKIGEQHPNRVNKEGQFIMKSDLTRSQQLNLADALEKIREVVRKAAFVPTPVSEETVEKLRKRKEKAVMERLKEKHSRSQIKQDRAAPSLD